LTRSLAFIWKALVGIALCLTPVTAILVLGWTSRAMQRAVLKAWHAENGGDTDRVPYRSFARGSIATRRLASWPNWFIAEDLGPRLRDSKAAEAGIPRRVFVLVVSLLSALWSNLRLGFLTLFATWAATAPIVILWLLSWWGGWENSFNKGYEQAWVGPVIGVAAALMFMVFMTYVPLAQARLATAGTWRAFFDYKLIRSLVAGNPFAVLRLTIYFVLAGLVIAILRAVPLAAGNYLQSIATWPEERLMALKLGYYVFCAAIAFALFLGLRLAAARIYARALLKALRAGRIKADRLSDTERDYLAALKLLEPETREDRGVMARAAVSTGRGIMRFAAAAPALILWFVFVAQIYIAQFLNHDWLAWVNHPLVQLPWMMAVRLWP
jgi:hypothetical protein